MVCSTGIGTSRMIATQIDTKYDLKIVDTLSLRQFETIMETMII